MTIAMNELAVKYTLYTYLVVINGRKWIRICAQVKLIYNCQSLILKLNIS